MIKSAKILIVEDEMITAMELRYLLEERGYEVAGIASSGQQAIDIALNTAIDLILLDIFLKGPLDGIQVARAIQKQKNIPVIYVTGNIHLQETERLQATHPADILCKPVTASDLLDSIHRVYHESRS